MQTSGLTGFAWMFMLVSMISVTLLVVWCYYRILSSEREFGDGSGGEAPGRAEIH